MNGSQITPLDGLFLAAGMMVAPLFGAVSVDYVRVGNADNANDTSGYGGVAYEYQIARNETTIGDYAQFLNAKAQSDPYGLYNPSMGSNLNVAGITRSGVSGSYTYSVLAGSENHPITYVSWFDAARYVNWLGNGQGSGSTEMGAYTLEGATSGIVLKNPGATIWIPSEDEWYKAAYYDPTKGGTGGYWLHANQSNTMTSNTIGVAGAANYNESSQSSSQNYLTDVGAYGSNSDSYYGTNDQAGNVTEWNDAVINGGGRGRRGGSWSFGRFSFPSSLRDYALFSSEDYYTGFRVASIPEPSSILLTVFASGMMFVRRKRSGA